MNKIVKRRFRSGSYIYVIELKEPRAWRLACGISGTATAWLTLKEAREYQRMVIGRGIPCRIIRYNAGEIVRYRETLERF
jgi:hypothetical protein